MGRNPKVLKDAIEMTSEKRGSVHILSDNKKILDNIRNSDTLKGFWNRYQKISAMQMKLSLSIFTAALNR